MKFITPTLLIFSQKPETIKSLDRYIKYSQIDKDDSYRFIWDKSLNKRLIKECTCLTRLMAFFESLEPGVLANLILLIDVYSFNDKESSDKRFSDNWLREFILSFPEVKILFLNPGLEDDPISIRAMLNLNEPVKLKSQIFDTSDLNGSFKLAVGGRSNMFDFSGLRVALKWSIIKHEIKANKDNFAPLHYNRLVNFALTVDEEKKQTYFNAYAFFRYGYRVLPVVSYMELNNLIKRFPELCRDKKLLVLRDYDLQFEDYDIVPAKEGVSLEKRKEILKHLRGFDLNEEKNYIKGEIWCCLNKQSIKEEGIQTSRMYFITRLDDFHPLNRPKRKKGVKYDLYCRFGIGKVFKKKGKDRIFLNGMTKPLTGIFNIHAIIKEDIKHNGGSVANSENEIKELAVKINTSKVKGVGYSIDEILYDESEVDLTREESDGSGHSTSPKILHIGEALISRARRYMEQKMFLCSALLAQEAMEVLNGFHFLEMLDALYIRTIAETKLEVENIGVKDDPNIVYEKFKEIRALAKRFTKNNDPARDNIMNQLAIDLRHIYLDKELLESADACLREYVKNTAGLDISIPFKPLLKKMIGF